MENGVLPWLRPYDRIMQAMGAAPAESRCSGRRLAQDSQDAPGRRAHAPFPTRMPFPGGRGVSGREPSGARSSLNHSDEGHWLYKAGLTLSRCKSSSGSI